MNITYEIWRCVPLHLMFRSPSDYRLEPVAGMCGEQCLDTDCREQGHISWCRGGQPQLDKPVVCLLVDGSAVLLMLCFIISTVVAYGRAWL